MLKPIGRWSARHIWWLPLALFLWPLVVLNYRARERGELPDEWYWADERLLALGFFVDS